MIVIRDTGSYSFEESVMVAFRAQLQRIEKGCFEVRLPDIDNWLKDQFEVFFAFTVEDVFLIWCYRL